MNCVSEHSEICRRLLPKRVWLIGGTGDSGAIAQALVAQNIPCVVTVTTPPARQLYPPADSLQVHVGAMDRGQLPAFLKTYQIGAIVDASHPHAANVSHNAIQVAEQLRLPYLRYERPTVAAPSVTVLPNWDALLESKILDNQRVLLIVGYRHLRRFQPWHNRATLFARILPSPVALDVAIAAGFNPRRLIALRPPITPELEAALWQQWKISLVVAKTSGVAGGTDVKQQVAAQLNIPLVLIARPAIAYPQQTANVPTIVKFCHRHLNSTA